jgi:hypothetical protein
MLRTNTSSALSFGTDASFVNCSADLGDPVFQTCTARMHSGICFVDKDLAADACVGRKAGDQQVRSMVLSTTSSKLAIQEAKQENQSQEAKTPEIFLQNGRYSTPHTFK